MRKLSIVSTLVLSFSTLFVLESFAGAPYGRDLFVKDEKIIEDCAKAVHSRYLEIADVAGELMNRMDADLANERDEEIKYYWYKNLKRVYFYDQVYTVYYPTVGTSFRLDTRIIQIDPHDLVREDMEKDYRQNYMSRRRIALNWIEKITYDRPIDELFYARKLCAGVTIATAYEGHVDHAFVNIISEALGFADRLDDEAKAIHAKFPDKDYDALLSSQAKSLRDLIKDPRVTKIFKDGVPTYLK